MRSCLIVIQSVLVDKDIIKRGYCVIWYISVQPFILSLLLISQYQDPNDPLQHLYDIDDGKLDVRI